MKKIILTLFVLGSAVVSGCLNGVDMPDNEQCVNSPSATQDETDKKAIEAYIAAKQLTDVQSTATGLHYKIINPGEGTTPTSSSVINITYTGKLTNGTLFDSATKPVQFTLGSLIPGWIEGLPKIKPGGKILLLIPSRLGYGTCQVSVIPGGSVLVFDVDLLSVN